MIGRTASGPSGVFSGTAFWAGLLALSLLGWGHALKTLTLGQRPFPVGAELGLGLAGAVVLGGGLNAAGVASRVPLATFVAAGALLGLRRVMPLFRWVGIALGPPATPGTRRLRGTYLVLLATILVVVALATVRAGAEPGISSVARFNPHDDFHAYLVFPERMLQTGEIGADPFNDRRLTTGLGGQSALLAMARVFMPFESLHLIEPGLGVLSLCSLIGAGWGAGVGLTGLSVFLPLTIANVSGQATGVALLLGLTVVLALWPTEGDVPVGVIVLSGLAAAAACALKSTFLPPTVIALGAFLTFRAIRGGLRRRHFLEGAGVLAVVALALLPWMLTLHRSSGTMLFPVLGLGVLGESPPPFGLLSSREQL